MAQPSVFGHISQHPVGTSFDSRAAVRQSGLHRHDMAGISGAYDEGADAIIVSGGYGDDVDLGDEIIYTGQGGQENGKQVRDQELTRGNRALVISENLGLPVRVIRGSGGDPQFSPSTGYRYDGLFSVVEHWQESSHDGPVIWRYRLVKHPRADDVRALPSTRPARAADGLLALLVRPPRCRIRGPVRRAPMTITCPHCLNRVSAYRVGVMTVKVAHHHLNNGGLCPGSEQMRSLAG
jgi:hypothetical protein